MAEHAGESWASEDAVGGRGIDHCDSTVGIVMAEIKKRLIMPSSESAHTPVQVSSKKL